MSKWSAIAGAALVASCLAGFAGCARKPPPAPLVSPQVQTRLEQFSGTPLSGPTTRSVEPVAADQALSAQVRFVVLERLPPDALESLGARARLIAATNRGRPVLPSTRLTGASRFATGEPARAFADQIQSGALGPAADLAGESGALLPGTTLVVRAAGSGAGGAGRADQADAPASGAARCRDRRASGSIRRDQRAAQRDRPRGRAVRRRDRGGRRHRVRRADDHRGRERPGQDGRRVTGMVGLGGGKKQREQAEDVQIAFAAGDVVLDASQRAALEAVIARLQEDRKMELVLRHELGSADVQRVEPRANPSPQDAQNLAYQLRQNKMDLLARRAELAGRAKAELISGASGDAPGTLAQLRALDGQIAQTEDALDYVLELLRPGADRQAARRTRSASIEVGDQRLSIVRDLLLASDAEDAQQRIRVTNAQAAAGESETGQVVITLIPKKKR